MTVLDQVRVLELSSSIAAAYCARQFTLWGGEVLALTTGQSAPPPVDGVSLLHAPRDRIRTDRTRRFIAPPLVA